jgi:uncharacterized membrane protein YphA (DoxX/SURF4 family)
MTMHELMALTAPFLASAFLAVLFLQSGLDKVYDWQGNKEYIAGYFAKTFLAPFSTLLLFKITVMEVATGVLALVGCFWMVVNQDTFISWLASLFAGVTVLALFTGQRIAKDYAAAAAMIPYVLLTLGSLVLHRQ